jgi:hypothetical protein
MRRAKWARLGSPIAVAGALGSIAWGVSWHRRRRTRRGRVAFDREPFERAVAPGATGARDVRLWGRSSGAGRHELTIFEQPDGAEPGAAGRERAVATVAFDVPDVVASDGTWAVQYP